MASSDKLNKGRKIAKRNKIIVGLIIAACILITAPMDIFLLGNLYIYNLDKLYIVFIDMECGKFYAEIAVNKQIV